jgi:Predicted signal-transduction protein containing cAMP-binding and CBS domains
VFTIGADATLVEAASEMRREDVGSLVVFDEGRLSGIITERDLVRAVAEGANPTTLPVAGYMTDDPIVASPDDGVEEVVARMLTIGVRHLPVVENGRVLGVVSVRDLLEASAVRGG